MNNKLLLTIVATPVLAALLLLANAVYDMAGTNTTLATAASVAMVLITISAMALGISLILDKSKQAQPPTVTSSERIRKDDTKKIRISQLAHIE